MDWICVLCVWYYYQDALDIAVEKCNADIVTLLRLAKLNDDNETVDERQNKTCKSHHYQISRCE